MLQIQVLRQNPTAVKEKLTIKNYTDLSLIDTIIALDDERKKTQLEFDNNQAIVNITSKAIGGLMAKGQKEEAESRYVESNFTTYIRKTNSSRKTIA